MLGSDIYCQKDKRKDRGLRDKILLESCLERSRLRETFPPPRYSEKNLARKLAGKIAVARDFFPPASVSGNFQQKMSRRIRLGAKGSAAQHVT